MHIVYPVRLDQPIHLKNKNGTLYKVPIISKSDLVTNTNFFDASGRLTTAKGYDSSVENNGKGVRLTNLAGILNGDLLKNCPKCTLTKNQSRFGIDGRTTNELRDQSNCNDCRKVA